MDSRKIETTEQSIYTLMREMDSKTKLIVPIEQWALVRNYAGQLKRDFDAQYEIHRIRTARTKLNFILVTRNR